MSVNLVINKKHEIRTRLKPTNYENYKKKTITKKTTKNSKKKKRKTHLNKC